MTDILCFARNSYTDKAEGASAGTNYVAIRCKFISSFRMLQTDPNDIPNMSSTSQSLVFLILGEVSSVKLHFPPVCLLTAFLSIQYLPERSHSFQSSKITQKLPSSLTLRLLMSYIYGAPILDVSRSHTTTQHSR
jgi:hypothetical protein